MSHDLSDIEIRILRRVAESEDANWENYEERLAFEKLIEKKLIGVIGWAKYKLTGNGYFLLEGQDERPC